MEKIVDAGGRRRALEVTRRRDPFPRTFICYGSGLATLDIYEHPDETSPGNPFRDVLAINGVRGTVDQWRQILLPLLGLAYPPAARLIETLFEQPIAGGKKVMHLEIAMASANECMAVVRRADDDLTTFTNVKFDPPRPLEEALARAQDFPVPGDWPGSR